MCIREMRTGSAVRRFRIAKRAGGRKSDIPPDKSKSAARDEDPNRKANVQHENSIPPGESGRVARYEKSIYRMMGEEAAGDLVRTDLWRDHDGAEGARLKS